MEVIHTPGHNPFGTARRAFESNGSTPGQICQNGDSSVDLCRLLQHKCDGQEMGRPRCGGVSAGYVVGKYFAGRPDTDLALAAKLCLSVAQQVVGHLGHV